MVTNRSFFPRFWGDLVFFLVNFQGHQHLWLWSMSHLLGFVVFKLNRDPSLLILRYVFIIFERQSDSKFKTQGWYVCVYIYILIPIHLWFAYSPNILQTSLVIISDDPVDIASGQTTPINFELILTKSNAEFLVSCNPIKVNLCVSAKNIERCIPYSLTIGCADWSQGYNFTFRDYDGSVQYGIYW